MELEHYQSLDYCIDTGCDVAKTVLRAKRIREQHEAAGRKPKSGHPDWKLLRQADTLKEKHCTVCGACRFHQWLQENGYAVVRPKCQKQ